MSVNLYIASTPRHVYQAVGLAFSLTMDSTAYLLVFGIQKDTALMDACNRAECSPFLKVVFIDQAAPATLNRWKEFKQLKGFVSNWVGEIRPDFVFFGNDFKPLSQWILYCCKSTNPGCQITYVDEGIASYFYAFSSHRRWIEKVEGRIKSVLYGSWYVRPKVIGSSKYVDSALFTFPECRQIEYGDIHAELLSPNIFHSEDVKQFVDCVVEDKVLMTNVDKLDVVFLLPSMNLVPALYGTMETLRNILARIIDLGYMVGLKYHPKDYQGDLDLEAGLDVFRLPSYLPAELIFSKLKSTTHVLGDVSSALFTAKWLLTDSLVLAIVMQESVYTDTRRPLFNQIGVEFATDERALTLLAARV